MLVSYMCEFGISYLEFDEHYVYTAKSLRDRSIAYEVITYFRNLLF